MRVTMTAVFGVALMAFLLAAVVSLLSDSVSTLAEDPVRARRVTEVLLAVGVGTVSLAVLRLVWALARDDLTFAYVATQTRPGTSMALRIAGLWAGAEGSLLFFALMVTLIPTVAWWRGSAPPLRALPISILGVGLVGAVMTVAWPFDRLVSPPLTGEGVAPILEHPAMVLHPPLLYLGLALSLAPFVAMGSRLRWAAAGVGIGIAALGVGAWWAYAEVGWGGWWAWDPVENSALIVWLLMVAGIHSRTLAPWCFASAWPAVAAGTALTRTSLRTSVHAFHSTSWCGGGLPPTR